MRTTLITATLAAAGGVAASPAYLTLGNVVADLTGPAASLIQEVCSALPLDAFKTKFRHNPVPPEEAKFKLQTYTVTIPPQSEPGNYSPLKAGSLQSGAKCANPRVRVEWDNMSDGDKQKFMDGLKCLLTKGPSGQFSNAKNRFEDLAALHQLLTPNVHSNAKFLLWHRVFLYLFENLLRTECGFNGPLPWFDETRYAGRFSQSSIFSSKWLGGIAINGNCVRDGQLANLALHVGPGSSNNLHCLQRNGDASQTSQCSQEYVDICNSYPDFAGLAYCIEYGYHAYGHNGIGSVMEDVQASPGDPVFYLHHAFIDRAFRLYTNKNPQWLTQINGLDHDGNPLTLDTKINTYGMIRDFTIREVLDTTGTALCYRYDY